MILRKCLIFFAFFLVLVSVNAREYNDYESLRIRTQISSELSLITQGPNPNIDYVYVNLSFIPERNEFQDITFSVVSDPIAQQTINPDSIHLRWNNPQENKLKFNLNSQGVINTNFKHITTKVKFPIEENLEVYKEYLKPTETVTSNDPKIIAKANELAEGEDDLFVLVHKIGLWTKMNINYSLETLTAEVSQDASWVLENRRGVCDELTSLFVAMLRSLNIPSRLITGQSYTNIIDDFGNHAWAEVYFPGYGWIPFDPTYGQLGYVDSSHIKMKSSIDIKDSDLNYGWLSNNVGVSSSGLSVKSFVLSTGNLYEEDVELELIVLKNDVGPGSYVPIKVNVRNLNPYYLPVNLYISKAPEKVQDYLREILLKPDSEKSVFFIVQTPTNVRRGFIYSSEVEIKDNFNHAVNGVLRFTAGGEIYTLEEAQDLINKLKKEDEKIYSRNVELNCSFNKQFYYEDENGRISCEIINKGNVNLKDLSVCYNKQCEIINLNIVERKDLEFNFNPSDEEFFVTASNNDVNKFAILNPIILKYPDLTINNLTYSNEINYFDDFILTFNIDTNSEVENVRIRLNNKEIENLGSLSNKKDVIINLNGYDLKEINKISIIYQDKNGREYITEQEFRVNINKPFYIKYSWLIILFLIVIIISMILRRKRPHSRYYRIKSIYP